MNRRRAPTVWGKKLLGTVLWKPTAMTRRPCSGKLSDPIAMVLQSGKPCPNNCFSEASLIHDLVKQLSSYVDAAAHRTLLAQSAALVGKNRKLQKVPEEEYRAPAEVIIDTRVDLLREMQAAIANATDVSASSQEVQSIQCALTSISLRLGLHHRTQTPRPTTKTKRPKAHHKKK